MRDLWDIVVEYGLTVKPATYVKGWIACTPRYAVQSDTPEGAVLRFSEFAKELKASGELETLAPGMGRAL